MSSSSSSIVPSGVPTCPSLFNLSRHALLYGLALGCKICIPENIYLDDDFWNDLLQEASSRKLVCDAFLNGLVASGICISKLVLCHEKDIGISPDWFKNNGSSEKIFEHLTSFSYVLSSFSFMNKTHNNQNRNYCEELASLLHRLARSSNFPNKLTTLHLDLQQESSSSSSSSNISSSKAFHSHYPQDSYSYYSFSSSSTIPSASYSTLAGSIKACCNNNSLLQVLKLEGMQHMEVFENIEALVEACPSITTLSFSKSTGFRDRHGQALLAGTNLPVLQHLDLSYTAVHNLTFAALARKARTANNNNNKSSTITRLLLNGTTIEITWLRQILKNFQHLQTLEIQSCPRLYDGIELWNLLFADNNNNNNNNNNMLQQLQSLSIELWFSSQQLLIPPCDYYIHDEFDYNYDDDYNCWVCCYCTLINDYDSSRCAACYGKRRATTATDVEPDTPPTTTTNGNNTNNNSTSFSCYKFPKLPCCKLETLKVIVHVDENEERLHMEEELERMRYVSSSTEASSSAAPYGNNTTTCSLHTTTTTTMDFNNSEIATSAFVHELLLCIPTSTITDLCLSSSSISSTSSSSSSSKKRSFTLGLEQVSLMVEKLGSTLRTLDLCSVLFTDDGVFSLFSGLPQLRELTVTGDGIMQPCIPTILGALSTLSSTNDLCCCEYLEKLTLVVVVRQQHSNNTYENHRMGEKKSTTNHHPHTTTTSETLIRAPSLEKVWIQGCPSTERISFDTPLLGWIHLSNCELLSHVSLHESLSTISMIQHLQIKENPSLDPYSIASLKLPNLKRLDIDGMHNLQDWQLKKLIDSACFSLTGIRLNCRGLGNISSLLRGYNNGYTTFHQPLSVLQIYRPSTSFDISNLISLFTATTSEHRLRDLIVHRATGLKGILSASSIILSTAAGFIVDTKNNNNRQQQKSLSSNYSFLHQSPSSSRLGAGATVDADDDELMGMHHIERVLQEAFLRDGIVRYQFPPTLNSFQRRLVHEAAEVMGLAHESIRLGRGVKAVEVRMIRSESRLVIEEGGVADAAIVGDGADFNSSRQRNVMFHLDDDSSSSNGEEEDSDDGAGADAEGQFEIDIEGTAMSAAVTAMNMSEEEQAPVALSRRAARLACKRKGSSTGSAIPPILQDPSALPSGEDAAEINGGGGALDATLQCEITGYVDSKLLRRLVAAGRQLPIDSRTFKPVCIRYLRGVCPYHMNSGNCNYAHMEIQASKLKKFSQLMDFVCGRDSDTAAGNRIGLGSARKNSNSTSYGRSEGTDVMESNLGGTRKGARRKSRSGSFGSETDDYDDESHFALGGGTPTSRSPGFPSSPNMYSSSPNMTDSTIQYFPPRLDLACLLRLELTNCEGLTGASLSGPCLVHVSFQGCKSLSFLDLLAPELQSLQMSDCIALKMLTLHRDSLRKLQVAMFTNCRELKESFMTKFVDHCRGLCQLHIFGCGASETSSGSNAKSRQKVKTKAAAKLTAGRPKLELFTTKKDWRMMKMKGEDARFEDNVCY